MKKASPSLVALLRGELPGLPGAADWASLTREARAEGVAPLAFWILSTSGKLPSLPPSAREALRESYFQTWKRNLEILNELEILAREFQRAGIPFVVLKGACFALTLYPDVGARPMGDLDLLVPAQKWEDSVKAAKALGYAEAHPEALPGLNETLAHEISLQRKAAQAVLVEIHRSLIGSGTFRYAAPMDWFWTQTRPLNHKRFPGALTFSPAAQLLYASAHAMLQHGGRRAPLRWFADADRLIRVHAGEMEWETLLRQAEMFAWSSALYATLQKTRDVFHTPIPPDVLKRLAERADRNQSLVEELEQTPLTHTHAEIQKMAALTFQGKLRLALALAFPSPAYMRWRYSLKSSRPLPLYYPLRWLRILMDGLQTLAAFLKTRLARFCRKERDPRESG